MNIERKRLLKQRREKTLLNTKGRKPAEEYFLTALKASHKTHRALKNTQKRKKSDNLSINDENMNITMIADNINNLEIVETMRLMLQQMQKIRILNPWIQII